MLTITGGGVSGSEKATKITINKRNSRQKSLLTRRIRKFVDVGIFSQKQIDKIVHTAGQNYCLEAIYWTVYLLNTISLHIANGYYRVMSGNTTSKDNQLACVNIFNNLLKKTCEKSNTKSKTDYLLTCDRMEKIHRTNDFLNHLGIDLPTADLMFESNIDQHDLYCKSRTNSDLAHKHSVYPYYKIYRGACEILDIWLAGGFELDRIRRMIK